MSCFSRIVITADIGGAVEHVSDSASECEVVRIVKEDTFLVEDAMLAIEKAYLASNEKRLIVMAAREFSVIVQNKLLKILEEPPEGTHFVLIASHKASLLPTIRSRLPIEMYGDRGGSSVLDFSIEKLDLAKVYALVQDHQYSNASTVQSLIEALASEAIKSEKFEIDYTLLELFRDAIKALDKGSIPSFVLTAVLLKLLAKKRR